MDIVKPLVEAALADYLLELRQGWESVDSIIVRVAQLETRIMAIEGVVDISGTTLNDSTQNLVLTAYEVPMPGEVVL